MDDEVGVRDRIVRLAHVKQIAVPTGSDERDAAVVLRNHPREFRGRLKLLKWLG